MKTTSYFDFTRRRADRKCIKEEWITSAVLDPIEEVIQTDGRIRRWTWVADEGKFLRVILLEGGETIHNAFFDRNYSKEENQ